MDYLYDNEEKSYKIVVDNGTSTTTGYFALNQQGDVIALLDEEGNLAASYRYNAWGKILEETANPQNAWGTVLLQYNCLKYRGYYYDSETGFYYLNSRYYDPVIGRFINADGYITTGQGVLSYNMYAYCSNNPVNRIDPDGHAWKDIKNWFSKTWNKVKTWAKNTFGGEVTTVTTVDYSEKIISEPWPIVVETGTSNTTTVTQKGNSSKPISGYAQGDITHPIKSSSAGLKINVSKFTLDGSIGLDKIGVTGSWANGNQTDSFGIRANLSEAKIGFEYSTAIQWDNTTQTTYTNVSISGLWILAAYVAATSGQGMLQPAGVY